MQQERLALIDTCYLEEALPVKVLSTQVQWTKACKQKKCAKDYMCQLKLFFLPWTLLYKPLFWKPIEKKNAMYCEDINFSLLK